MLLMETLSLWTIRSLVVLIVVATLLPEVRKDAWWIRACEFPRVQILVLALLALPWILIGERPPALAAVLAAVVAAAALWQLVWVLPFTAVWPRRPSRDGGRPGGAFGVLVANVLMTNRQAARFFEMVERLEPDVLLVVEADRWWQQELELLRDRYPHAIEHPRDDTYGLLLYSRLPLEGGEVRFLISDQIPSIQCRLAVNGRGPQTEWVEFYGLHPRPPAPQESATTSKRDAELLVVARRLAETTGPAVVAGDLNDVPWSWTTHLFGRLSGLVDPRVGRGPYSTFPAARPWLRFPIDHVFHSPELALVELRLGPDFGSDHLPLLVRLALDPEVADEAERTEALEEDREIAERKIRKVEEDLESG